MTVLTQAGDKLQGNRIRIVARKIDAPRLSWEERSGTHKRMFTVARDTVECIIEEPARWVMEKKPESKR
jgi:hypothetical protein